MTCREERSLRAIGKDELDRTQIRSDHVLAVSDGAQFDLLIAGKHEQLLLRGPSTIEGEPALWANIQLPGDAPGDQVALQPIVGSEPFLGAVAQQTQQVFDLVLVPEVRQRECSYQETRQLLERWPHLRHFSDSLVLCSCPRGSPVLRLPPPRLE